MVFMEMVEEEEQESNKTLGSVVGNCLKSTFFQEDFLNEFFKNLV